MLVRSTRGAEALGQSGSRQQRQGPGPRAGPWEVQDIAPAAELLGAAIPLGRTRVLRRRPSSLRARRDQRRRSGVGGVPCGGGRRSGGERDLPELARGAAVPSGHRASQWRSAANPLGPQVGDLEVCVGAVEDGGGGGRERHGEVRADQPLHLRWEPPWMGDVACTAPARRWDSGRRALRPRQGRTPDAVAARRRLRATAAGDGVATARRTAAGDGADGTMEAWVPYPLSR